MRNRAWLLFLIFTFATAPAFALEMKNPENPETLLRMELEAVPAPSQDFDQYVQELAASARADASTDHPKSDEAGKKNRQPKSLNPLVLFRW